MRDLSSDLTLAKEINKVKFILRSDLILTITLQMSESSHSLNSINIRVKANNKLKI